MALENQLLEVSLRGWFVESFELEAYWKQLEPRFSPALRISLRRQGPLLSVPWLLRVYVIDSPSASQLVLERPPADLEKDVLAHALTLDAVANVPTGHKAAIVGRAENLFDVDVVTRNQRGSIDLGTPRPLWIGVRLH